MYIFIKVFLRQIYSYSFYISKLNNLKIIHDFIFPMFNPNHIFKTTFFIDVERVHDKPTKIYINKAEN
jgi:hypothetical protein